MNAPAPASAPAPTPALARLRATRPLKHVLIARLIAGLPLAGFGAMHLLGMAPMRPILEAAHIPMPGLNAVVAPFGEIVAGVMILTGFLTRAGAALGVGIMTVALYSHIVATWPDEPTPAISVAVLLACLYLLWRGGGAWSIDARA